MGYRSITADTALSEALADVLGSDSADLIRRLGNERRAIANMALLELLANVPEAELDVVQSDFERQKSIAPDWMQPASGIRLVRVTKAASELAMPVVGLALALYHLVTTGDAAGVPVPLMKTAKGFWGNIVTLRPPQDDDAIAVVRCLAQSGAKEMLMSGHRTSIDTSTLANGCSMSRERLTVALTTLHRLNLITAGWAGTEGNFADPRNSWSLSL